MTALTANSRQLQRTRNNQLCFIHCNKYGQWNPAYAALFKWEYFQCVGVTLIVCIFEYWIEALGELLYYGHIWGYWKVRVMVSDLLLNACLNITCWLSKHGQLITTDWYYLEGLSTPNLYKKLTSHGIWRFRL